MNSELVKRLTGMSDKELREYTWPAVTSETKIFSPPGFLTPEDVEARREELRNRPTPEALQPPPSDEPNIFFVLL